MRKTKHASSATTTPADGRIALVESKQALLFYKKEAKNFCSLRPCR
jgi:hypothetical protein